MFLNSFLFLITFYVFLNSFQNYFFKWLACLQVSSVLMNCNIWSSYLFSASSCFPRFSWPRFSRVRVQGSGLGPGFRSHPTHEVVHVTIGNPAFCLFLYLTGVHFRGGLQHFGDVTEQKNQVLTNQNSRNRWCQIVRRTIRHPLKTKKLNIKQLKIQ